MQREEQENNPIKGRNKIELPPRNAEKAALNKVEVDFFTTNQKTA
jgi:hypothetical protein